MSYTIKYNRTSNHIGGLTVRTTGGGKDMGDHVSDYSQNACGSLTRYRFADGESFERLTDALEAARKAGGRKLCKTCEKAAEAELQHIEEAAKAAEVEEHMTTPEFSELVGTDIPESANVLPVSTTNGNTGETMAAKTAKLDVTTDDGKAALEQIDANIERAQSLAEAENVEALEELNKETEAIISSLTGQGSIKAKKEKRDAFKAAATVQEKPKAEVTKVHTGTVAPKTWDQYEGTVELVQMGAEKVAEGIKAHVKVSNLAKEIAAISYDVWTRIPNKAGVPDLVGDSDAAKKGARAIYDKALPLFEDNYDNASALKKLIRSAQDYRSDVRAEWLRSLDLETEEAAERRALVSKVLEDKPEDEKASEWVANVYGTSTIGQSETKRLAYQEKKKRAAELEASAGKGESEGGEGEGEGDGEEGKGAADTTTPDERATKLTEKLVRDIKTGKPEDFEKATEETKEAIRAKLEEAMKGLKAMIAATL
ncbi:hypothetical protein IPZ61_15790 [Streptomyces sioyaensis]|uniref:hypothetical protein n=1 Tax=Streptomyces sioyaensis TaxID=67364 RepID=UPI001F325599|nr:hypothetical protein [Streptomyces sioyaensis]MCF3174780.1 hypothetical protein [Streptomyces sioyaensis]